MSFFLAAERDCFKTSLLPKLGFSRSNIGLAECGTTEVLMVGCGIKIPGLKQNLLIVFDRRDAG